MKNFFFILTIIISNHVLGQTTVFSDDYLVNTRQEQYQWKINGVTFIPTKEKTVIYPNYPEIDTIIFIDKNNNKTPDTIFSRIPRDQEYIMTISCCDSYFDIFKVERNPIENNDDSLSNLSIDSMLALDSNLALDSLIWASKEYGQVKFIIKNKPRKDTLICIYTDFAGFPYGQIITKRKNYDWLLPSKGFYSGNNDYIVFAHKKETLEYEVKENDIISWGDPDFYANFEVLKKFRIRLFNKEKVIIEYDYLTRETKLKFQQ